MKYFILLLFISNTYASDLGNILDFASKNGFSDREIEIPDEDEYDLKERKLLKKYPFFYAYKDISKVKIKKLSDNQIKEIAKIISNNKLKKHFFDVKNIIDEECFMFFEDDPEYKKCAKLTKIFERLDEIIDSAPVLTNTDELLGINMDKDEYVRRLDPNHEVANDAYSMPDRYSPYLKGNLDINIKPESEIVKLSFHDAVCKVEELKGSTSEMYSKLITYLENNYMGYYEKFEEGNLSKSDMSDWIRAFCILNKYYQDNEIFDNRFDRVFLHSPPGDNLCD